MNLEKFSLNFKQTNDIGNGSLNFDTIAKVNLNFIQLVEKLGGKTFNSGLYRVFRGDQIYDATEAIERAFPKSKGRLVAFGYDWLGRHFAIDNERVENGEPQIIMLEIGAGEGMQIPTSISDFHNIELVEYPNEALALPFFNEWKALNPQDVVHDQCVGYKIPLFLGGSDTVDNLEMIDLSVYVEICGQLRNKVQQLSNGQTIKSISIQ